MCVHVWKEVFLCILVLKFVLLPFVFNTSGDYTEIQVKNIWKHRVYVELLSDGMVDIFD